MGCNCFGCRGRLLSCRSYRRAILSAALKLGSTIDSTASTWALSKVTQSAVQVQVGRFLLPRKVASSGDTDRTSLVLATAQVIWMTREQVSSSDPLLHWTCIRPAHGANPGVPCCLPDPSLPGLQLYLASNACC